MMWAWLLVEVWVVLLAVAGVDGVCFGGVRGCGRACWPRVGSWKGSLLSVAAVDGAGFSCVRRRGYVRWPRCGSLCWPSLWSMVCSTRVFDVVGVSSGRGMGRSEGRTCGRPARLQTRSTVFDDVYVLAGRELGRLAGRCWCRRCVPQACSMTWARLLAEVWVAA